MRLLTLFTLLLSFSISAEASRNVKAELESIQKQRQAIQEVQQSLANELGTVGQALKELDLALLNARHAYQQVRTRIRKTDSTLQAIARDKNQLKFELNKLYKQMVKEVVVAYQHSGSQSVWVDVFSGTSITEIPHRQFLLKNIMISQESDRKVWRNKMDTLARLETEEKENREKLLLLQQEQKTSEQNLVLKIKAKKDAQKLLRSNLEKSKAQERRLARQEAALQRLLNGFGDTLLASDRKSIETPIRQRKGKLSLPLNGRILVSFGKETQSGTKLSGIHLSPKKRTEKGKQVHAFGRGQVRFADWFGGYGLMMIVDYGQGIMAVYAHNDALHKQLGDWVEKDEVIAEAGSTGWIEDIRLYLEIRDNGKPVNPSHWCKK